VVRRDLVARIVEAYDKAGDQSPGRGSDRAGNSK
jgi:hypothetical protein